MHRSAALPRLAPQRSHCLVFRRSADIKVSHQTKEHQETVRGGGSQAAAAARQPANAHDASGGSWLGYTTSSSPMAGCGWTRRRSRTLRRSDERGGARQAEGGVISTSASARVRTTPLLAANNDQHVAHERYQLFEQQSTRTPAPWIRL